MGPEGDLIRQFLANTQAEKPSELFKNVLPKINAALQNGLSVVFPNEPDIEHLSARYKNSDAQAEFGVIQTVANTEIGPLIRSSAITGIYRFQGTEISIQVIQESGSNLLSCVVFIEDEPFAIQADPFSENMQAGLELTQQGSDSPTYIGDEPLPLPPDLIENLPIDNEPALSQNFVQAQQVSATPFIQKVLTDFQQAEFNSEKTQEGFDIMSSMTRRDGGKNLVRWIREKNS